MFERIYTFLLQFGSLLAIFFFIFATAVMILQALGVRL